MRHITFADHKVEVKRNHIAAVAFDHPHALFVDGERVGNLSDAEADAIGGLIALASEALT